MTHVFEPVETAFSQSAGMMDECPGYFELFRKVRRQGLHTKCLGRIVAPVKHVHPEVLRQRKGPMRPLPGDERVHSFAGGLLQFAARAAGDDANPTANLRPGSQQLRRTVQRPGQPLCQFSASDARVRPAANELAFLEKKRAALLQAQGEAQLRVVAKARMRVEWKV